MTGRSHVSRRTVLRLMAAGGAATLVPARAGTAEPGGIVTRPVPSSGEALPVIGLGTWVTFNVGDDPAAREECAGVMAAFFAEGGRLIDSSPMYGSSQDVIGHGLKTLSHPAALFAADKVWISSGAAGPPQIEQSRRRWGIRRFDLLQVHNLVSWEAHLPTLFAMRAERRLPYVGVTTSEGRRHREIEQVMRQQPIDLVQITYNVRDREVERRILPLAAERGIGVIVNRPFRQGALIRELAGEPLPGWAAELGCRSWAQALLKFIVSHPAVTCAIPATTRVDHLRENMAAGHAPLPDAALRRRMVADIEAL